jgi:sugar lactone lactonase YvrE
MRPARTQFVLTVVAVVALTLLMVADAPAQGNAPVFPDLIPLPPGFGPEGIAVGNGHTFYVGSLAPATLGQILVGDLRTGQLSQLVAPTGRLAAGMKFDSRSNFLFVAGGTSGRGTIYDAASGAEIAFYQFQPPGIPGINDVIVTRDAAYFTDSTRPFLYRVALGPQGQPGDARTIPLLANFGVPGGCTVGPPMTGNGIAATPNGTYVILVHMSEGQLYRMETATHTVVPIDLSGGDFLGGGDVCTADGMLLDGKTLYVVQNFLNRVAVVDLSPDYLSGFITRYITEPFTSNPATKVPTTIAEFGDSLYAVTAGFAPPAPDFVVQVSK